MSLPKETGDAANQTKRSLIRGTPKFKCPLSLIMLVRNITISANVKMYYIDFVI